MLLGIAVIPFAYLFRFDLAWWHWHWPSLCVMFTTDHPVLGSIDGLAFYALFVASGFCIYLYFSTMLLRFVLVWLALHRLLRRLYSHPSRLGYGNLRNALLPKYEATNVRLLEPRPTYLTIEFCLERARRILSLLPSSHLAGAAQRPLIASLVDHVSEAEVKLKTALYAEAKADWVAVADGRFEIRKTTAAIAADVASLFEPVWREDSKYPISLGDRDKEIVAEASCLIASRVLDFINHVFANLRNLVEFAMIGLLAMVLAISAYPFPQRDTLLTGSWIVLLTAIVICIAVFVQINRSRIVSMLSGTDPGHFNWDSTFILHVLLFGVLPILTLIGAQFPSQVGSLLGWFSGIFAGK